MTTALSDRRLDALWSVKGICEFPCRVEKRGEAALDRAVMRRRCHAKSIHLANVMVWILSVLCDGARPLPQREHHGEHQEYRLWDHEQNAEPFQGGKRRWPAIPERKRSAERNAEPDDRQKREKSRLWSADGLAR